MENNIRIIHALQALVPKAECSVKGDNYSGIVWLDERQKPTEKQVADMLAELIRDYSANEYARNRQAEFPSIQDLVVALYDTDDKSAIETKRAEVKAKYPKPE